jgi:hypothetical protein
MKPNFTGLWMPKEVLENKSLTLGEKFTYSIVDALDGDDGCYASNAYIADMLNLENRQVQNNLTKLINMGLVIRVYDSTGYRKLRTVASHAINCIPPMQSTACPPCNTLHPNSIEDNIVYKDTGKKIKGMIEAPVYPYETEAFIKAWMSWIDYRKECKKKLTHATIVKQFQQLKKMKSETKAIQAINTSIERGWLGLFEPTTTSTVITKEEHNNGF